MNLVEALYFVGYKVAKGVKTLGRKRLKAPVISVGNITLGGTGKTPAVIAIAEEALRRGFRPCILTRGYKGKIRKPVFVSRGTGALHGPADVGDEPVLMAERLPGVEIVKSASRYEGGLLAGNANLFIIDDGYQHWRLHRDRDILLIDSIEPFGNGRLFPMGKLREPLKEIKRADTIVVTRSNGDDDLIRTLHTYNQKATVYFSSMKPSRLVRQNGEFLPVENLAGRRVYAFCGIGNPGNFAQTLLRYGTVLVGFRSFRDHHVYRPEEIASMTQEAGRSKADYIVTTEKDMVKLGEISLPQNCSALRVEMTIAPGFYDSIFTFKGR